MGFGPSSCGTSSFYPITIHYEKEYILTTEASTLHRTSVKLVANTSNWRKVVLALIGDEPVSYEEKSKKDTLRKFPIVNIFSEDASALDRVLTKAAEVE